MKVITYNLILCTAILAGGRGTSPAARSSLRVKGQTLASINFNLTSQGTLACAVDQIASMEL